jgi:TP901 family phage tail tape measure protein
MAKKKIVIQTKYEVHGAEKVKGAYEGVGNEAQKAGNKVGGVNTQVKKTSGLIKSLKNMSGALGITAGVVVLGSAFRSAFNNVRKFSKANSNLAAVLNTTKGAIKELTTQQKQLGASTEFSASQVANAQIELAKMGFTMKQIGESTAGVLSLASASGAGLSESAEVMSATLKGFGLNASESGRVADTMAASFVNSSLDMNKFRESMKLVAPIARAANIDLDTTTALLGELANNGLAGSIAGTGLKNLMSKLSNENSKLSKELGFSVKNSEDLVRAFHELKKGNIDLTAATELTDERSKAAFLTMINGIDNVEALKVKLGEVGIAAKIAGENE